MRDCDNVELRELLPDLLHGRLSTEESVRVRAHVDKCADCSAELDLLGRVRASAPVPKVNADRISGALPAYRSRASWLASRRLRVAAAIVVTAGLGTLSYVAATDDSRPSDELAQRDTAIAIPTNSKATPRADTLVRSPAPAQSTGAGATELALENGLQDLSESDLRALLDEMASLEAVMPSEPEVVVPAFDRVLDGPGGSGDAGAAEGSA